MKYWILKKRLDDKRMIVLHAGPDCPICRGELVQADVPPAGRTTKKCNYCFA